MVEIHEVMQEIHNEQLKVKIGNGGYVNATVTCSLTVGPAGANLQGWITYNDGKLGKVHFISGTIREHAGACAVAAAIPDAMLVLEPGEIQSHGSFAASGGGLIVVGGALTLFNADGVVILQGLPLAGTGTPYYEVKGECNFERTE